MNRARWLVLLVAVAAAPAIGGQAQPPLPNRSGSLKFAAIGDNGTGDTPQYEVGEQMARLRASFAFDFVIMLGDNMYGSQRPADFVKKFESPYAKLLQAGVKFQASLGNHDRPENVSYRPFNMNGQRYYSFARGNVRFFALDSTQMDARQVAWIDDALQKAHRGVEGLLFPPSALLERGSTWFVGRSARPARADLRQARRRRGVLGARPCVRTAQATEGHLLFRVRLRRPIAARQHSPTDQTAAYFDQDQSFMLVEVAGAEMYFQVISRTGKTVDSGTIRRQQ